MAPKQTAKHLLRNLQQCSPDKRIDPKLLPCVRRKVRKFRKELTSELLDRLKMDDSFGALNPFVQERWFTMLLEKHNDPDSDYHFNLFDVVVIGQDLNVEDDIVYMNTSSLWFLLNFLRNIAAGWLTQLNGDVTFKVNRRGVAALSLQFAWSQLGRACQQSNLLGHYSGNYGRVSDIYWDMAQCAQCNSSLVAYLQDVQRMRGLRRSQRSSRLAKSTEIHAE